MTHKTDICIIGAGPVGLFAAFQAGMLGMKSHIVDALDFIGGQCNALYPEKPIYDIPAYPEISAEDLIKNLEKQASPFSPTYHLGQQVVGVDSSWLIVDGNNENPSTINNQPSTFKITTSNNTIIEAKVIIIAAGCGAFGPNKPPISGLEEFEKTGKVAYMVRSKNDFIDKNVVIAGGGDSAVDWANILSSVAKKVYVIHRRDKFRAIPESVSQMKDWEKKGKLEFVIPYQLAGLEGENGSLKNVIVEDLDKNKKAISADNLLCFFGLAMELGPIANWGLNLHHSHIIVEPHNMQTNIEGIYAVGDICNYKGKLKLISCGFAEVAMACHSAYERVFGKPLHFEYSTSKGVPK
ncbi:MAG: NAD(P)/FAD-dependent oxidoreductase [Rickettsiales bacterium]|nr:NAD(P)/FAD-dependent oxidoreductase [Rickettsiales bacterium]